MGEGGGGRGKRWGFGVGEGGKREGQEWQILCQSKAFMFGCVKASEVSDF